MAKKLAGKTKPTLAASATVKKRGRPKTRRPGNVVSGFRLRDTLRQLEADSPAVEFDDAAFKVQTRTAADMLRLYKQGHVVFVSRGILRAIIAELG